MKFSLTHRSMIKQRTLQSVALAAFLAYGPKLAQDGQPTDQTSETDPEYIAEIVVEARRF